MTTTTAPTENRLREEDLEVGRKWVHPDTQLEYEDFHAFLCGQGPLDHWQNDRIRELHRQKAGWAGDARNNREPWEVFFRRRCAYFRSNFTREGTLVADRGEHRYFRPSGAGSAPYWAI